MPQRDGTGPPGRGCRRHGQGPVRRSGRAGGRRGAGGSGTCGRRGGGNWPTTPERSSPPAPPEPTSDQELNRLRAEARAVEEQIEQLKGGTGESPASRGRPTAMVDAEKCLLCRACEDICPSGAIAVTDKVVIAADKCSGCGACVQVCPNEAIRLV